MPHRPRLPCSSGHQRGIALYATLMMLALATVLASAAALLAHGDAMDVAQFRVRAEQRANLESAWTLVLARIGETQAAEPIAIAQLITIAAPEVDAPVVVDISDESGRIDLNAADDAVLLAYWRARGLTDAQSEQWLDRLRDWQDGDDIARSEGAEFVEYRNAHAEAMPRNARLAAVREFAQILSDAKIDPDCDANSFSVYTGAPEPNVLMATGQVRSMLEWADREQWRGRRWLPDGSVPDPGNAALIGRVLRITLKTGVKPDQLNEDNGSSMTNDQAADRAQESLERVVRVSGYARAPATVLFSRSRTGIDHGADATCVRSGRENSASG